MSERKRECNLSFCHYPSCLAYPSFLYLFSLLINYGVVILIDDLFLLLLQKLPVISLLQKHYSGTQETVPTQQERKALILASLLCMDSSLSPKLDSEAQNELEGESHASKKRKLVEKKVVTVRMETSNVGKLKNEGQPSDFWSWRKYGQKPIKGSPYPRGYYRCSTSKGCSAKKQVERSKTDSSVLIITYTSSHNHPGPEVMISKTPLKQPHQEKEPSSSQDHDHNDDLSHDDHQPPISPKREQLLKKEVQDIGGELDSFHYIQSPIRCSQDLVIDLKEDPFMGKLEKTCDTTLGLVLDEELPCSFTSHSQVTCLSTTTPKLEGEEEENFFDELEELPTSSFTGFMGSYHLSNEIRIPVVPS